MVSFRALLVSALFCEGRNAVIIFFFITAFLPRGFYFLLERKLFSAPFSIGYLCLRTRERQGIIFCWKVFLNNTARLKNQVTHFSNLHNQYNTSIEEVKKKKKKRMP